MNSKGSRGRAVRGSILILALLMGLLLVLSVGSPSGATHEAGHDVNASIVFYKPTSKTTGKARFGTLSEGTLTMKGSLETKKWTHAVVGHDSLLFYNSNTGTGLTGRFVNGVFTRRSTFWIPKGFNRVVASCDSVLFYKRETAKTLVGKLKGGWLSELASNDELGVTGIDHISSSCDTIVFWRNERSAVSSVFASGELSSGVFVVEQQGAHPFVRDSYTHLTNTADSYLHYAKNVGFAEWGDAETGSITRDGSTDTFGVWSHVAATGDSVLFYNTNSGVAARVILKDGLYNDEAPGTGVGQLAKGWKIIAGGR